MISYPQTHEGIGATALTRPEDIFAVKETRSGKTGHLSVSIPSSRLEEATEAMTTLKKLNMFRSNAALTLDALLLMARLVQEDERFAEMFREMSQAPDDE